jgi:hypothetical protein
LLELFEQAKIPEPELRTIVGEARFSSMKEWIHTDVRGWTLADRMTDEQYQLLRHEAPRALAAFAAEGGSVRFDSPAHIVSARKPRARSDG